jgi:spore maturation protein CgeB
MALEEAARLVPGLDSRTYEFDDFDPMEALDQADVVIVHEWTKPGLVAKIGSLRARGGRFRLLFHDTHHRAATAPDEMSALELDGYDGVLAFGEILREIYLKRGWAHQVHTWHEAADTALFRPLDALKETDVVWIGNWGDGERSAELEEFLIGPMARLGAIARIHGVRYPAEAKARLREAGIDYRGWLPNHRAPAAFARARLTLHVPRRPYVRALPGIPTIRMFEALACRIPLLSAPWDDVERLFPEDSYVRVASGAEMQNAMRRLLDDKDLARSFADRGLRAILDRHTCAHRVRELLNIVAMETSAPKRERISS